MPRLFTMPRTHPDLDGLACAVSYAELLRAQGLSAQPWIEGTPDPEARFVAEKLGVRIDPPQVDSRIDWVVALVDASDVRGMPPSLDPQRVVEVIDHRLHHRAGEIFPRAALCIEPVGAAATLVWERYQKSGVSPSRCAAQLLQAAVFSNTQGLRGTITTERDRAAFRALDAQAPLPPGFGRAQFDARRRALTEDLPLAIVQERKDFDHPHGSYTLSQLELPGAASLVDECRRIVTQQGPRAMLNLVDLESVQSFLIVPNPDLREWVAERAALDFEGDVATIAGILLRKQIVARLELQT